MSRDPAALDFYGLLRTLLEHDAEFVLIGGFALGFHGVPRGTKDVDIVPDPSPANIGRLWQQRSSRSMPRRSSTAILTSDRRRCRFLSLSTGSLKGGNWALHTRLWPPSTRRRRWRASKVTTSYARMR